MQNGQTEPKLYVYTTQVLFVHSKKGIVKTTGLAGGLHLPYKGILLTVLVSTSKSLPTAFLFQTTAKRFFICPSLLALP